MWIANPTGFLSPLRDMDRREGMKGGAGEDYDGTVLVVLLITPHDYDPSQPATRI